MEEVFCNSHDLKSELRKHYLYLSRGSGLAGVKKKSLGRLNSLKNKLYYLSGKGYLARFAKKEEIVASNNQKIIKIGKKYPLKVILQKLLNQEKIRFFESGFVNPQQTSKVIKSRGFYKIQVNKELFPKAVKVNFLKEVWKKICWPELTFAFPKVPPVTIDDRVKTICDFLLNVGVARQGLMNEKEKEAFKKEIKYFVSCDEPIRISYYLFCGKIGNPAKVNRRKPNLADFYGFYKLSIIEKELRKFYRPAKFAFSIEWFIVDQTLVQRFDIPSGQEISTRKIYKKIIKYLGAEGYIHLIGWEELIDDKKEFFKETNRLKNAFAKDYLDFLKKKQLPEENRRRAEKMAERIHCSYGIINPFVFSDAQAKIEDLLVLYNDFFPGVHFKVLKETPFQKELKKWTKKRSVWESGQYLGSLEARKTTKNFLSKLPKTISATVTRKQGRFVLDYLGCGKVEGTRFFPDVGEAVIFPNKEITIMPYLTIISYPSKFIPIFIKEYDNRTPFFWLAKDFKMGYL